MLQLAPFFWSNLKSCRCRKFVLDIRQKCQPFAIAASKAGLRKCERAVQRCTAVRCSGGYSRGCALVVATVATIH